MHLRGRRRDPCTNRCLGRTVSPSRILKKFNTTNISISNMPRRRRSRKSSQRPNPRNATATTRFNNPRNMRSRHSTSKSPPSRPRMTFQMTLRATTDSKCALQRRFTMTLTKSSGRYKYNHGNRRPNTHQGARNCTTYSNARRRTNNRTNRIRRQLVLNPRSMNSLRRRMKRSRRIRPQTPRRNKRHR